MKGTLGLVLMLAAMIFAAGCGGGDNGGPGVIIPPPIGNKLSGADLGAYLEGNPETGSVVQEANLRTYVGYVAANFSAGRTYGSGAGLEKFPAIAKSVGLKVAAGCWLSSNLAANTAEVDRLIVNCKAKNVDIAVVGNEVLLRHDLTEDQLLGYMAQVKATGVKVTTAEPWDVLVAHPRVMAACDEIFANIYPFWEGVDINQAILRLQFDYAKTVAAAGGKKVVISETGWPSAGGANQAAVPSPQNAAKYFAEFVAWANAQNVEYYYFAMFDEPWKTEPGMVGPHWGIWDSTMKLKPGMEGGFNAGSAPPSDPALDFTVEFGATSVAGTTVGINPTTNAVALYLFVPATGGWWTKPLWNQPTVPIKWDGSWSGTIVTGSNDGNGTKVAAFAIPTNYSPPILSGASQLPQALYDKALAYKIADRSPSFPYTPIANVPQAVNDLGWFIAWNQRSIVTPGGDQYHPGFSDADKAAFENSGKLAEMLQDFKADARFAAGVAEIRNLTANQRATVFAAYARPLYPTWAMNGHIGPDGTTNAGYAVEVQIADTLTNAVKTAL